MKSNKLNKPYSINKSSKPQVGSTAKLKQTSKKISEQENKTTFATSFEHRQKNINITDDLPILQKITLNKYLDWFIYILSKTLLRTVVLFVMGIVLLLGAMASILLLVLYGHQITGSEIIYTLLLGFILGLLVDYSSKIFILD